MQLCAIFMKLLIDPKLLVLSILLIRFAKPTAFAASSGAGSYLSPTALAATSDGKTLFIACASTNYVLRFDTSRKSVVDSIVVPALPSGLALSANDTRLYVTCAAPEGKVCIIDLANREVVAIVPAGHTAMAPVLSPDGKTPYACRSGEGRVGE